MEKRILGIGFLVAVGLLLLPAISRAQTATLSSQYSHWKDASVPGVIDEGGCFTTSPPTGPSPTGGEGGTTCYRWIGTVPSLGNTLLVHVAGNAEIFDSDETTAMQAVTIENDRTGGAPGSVRAACINGHTSQDEHGLSDLNGWMAVLSLDDDEGTFRDNFERLITSFSETWCCSLQGNVATKDTKHAPGVLALPQWLVRVRGAGASPEDGDDPVVGEAVDFNQMNITLQSANITGSNLDPYFGSPSGVPSLNNCGVAPDVTLPPGA